VDFSVPFVSKTRIGNPELDSIVFIVCCWLKLLDVMLIRCFNGIFFNLENSVTEHVNRNR
jgi:hypothetical protein